MAQKDLVNERDFYAQKEVELYDVLKYALIVILANFMAYYLVSCIYSFISKLAASSMYLILQSIFIYVPICAVLPVFLIFQYIRHFVPKNDKMGWCRGDSALSDRSDTFVNNEMRRYHLSGNLSFVYYVLS